METPPPNDSSKASLSPPVGRLCSFRKRLANKQVFKQRVKHYYQWLHSETALLSIKNEVHLSLACGEPTAIVLLDLSAAFDTIDHNILLGYLKSWFGLGGTVLKWFASYNTT